MPADPSTTVSFAQASNEDEAGELDGLAELPQWVAWREELRKGNLTKVPYSPASGRKASTTDPATWGTRAEAEARARVIGGGIGIVLSELVDGRGSALVGVDLDACRDPSTGTVAPWAAEIAARVGTYAEVSPSGTGIKLFGLVPLPGLPALLAAVGVECGRQKWGRKWTRGKGRHGPAVELYLGQRFFAVTGRWDLVHGLRQLDPGTLLELIDAEKARAAEAAPITGKGTGDQSRSGRALALAGKVRREGGTREGFDTALQADPELAEWAQDTRQVDRAWAKSGDGLADLEGFAFNEDGVALAFVARFRDQLRFDHHAGQWYRWMGTHWQPQETRLAFAWCRDTCRAMALAGVKDPATRALAKAATAAAVERLAQADQALAVTSADWDRDPWLLGTPGGTVELRTGELRPARPDDRITKQASAAPSDARDCPRWLAFLAEATSCDIGLIRFLQQWAGYCLTGDTREHALLFIYGPGGNGKSVFLNTLTGILGDYCRTAGMEVFSATKEGRHPQELARLKGARMVCASETEEGRAWAEVRIKQLTGGDTITARFMRQNDFEFRPEFKLVVIGNHKPVLQNVDAAARRRFNVVPFDCRPANPDPELEAKLRAEWPGILAWMIAGCRDWQAHGLQRPRKVLDATAEYFEEQDTFGRWLAEGCEIGRAHVSTVPVLWDSWTCFASSEGESAMRRNKGFTDALRARGFKPIKDTHGIRGRGFQGLKPRDDLEDGL